MAGLEGVRQVLLSLAPQADVLNLLPPGRALQGVVREFPQGLFVVVKHARIPLEPGAPLVSGQRVLVELMQTADGPRLRVAAEPRAAPSLREPSVVTQVLNRILDSLSGTASSSTLQAVLPPNLPSNESAVRELLSLFATRNNSGDDLRQVAALLQRAAAAGAIPREVAESVAILLAGSGMDRPERIEEFVRRWAPQSRRSGEALVAKMEARTSANPAVPLAESPRQLLLALSEHPALSRYLDETGQRATFERGLDLVLDRLSATDLQNLRALGVQYAFVELPFPAEGPLQRVQVHFLGGGRHGRNRFDAENAAVVLDISTTRLGDLWIALNVVRGRCACIIRAVEAAATSAIEANSEELIAALRDAGYSAATVEVLPWNGDRLEQLALVLGPLSGLSVSA
ncbi:MAG: hypothetical protein HY706_14985 [Candidatus Hydrogenedentes bacterium]|nr:hypothetical protein [Candidatus Hydrogenedentota bacterium]